jgi:putative redox protein
MTGVRVTSLDGYAQRVETDPPGHTFVVDEPAPTGADEGPDPYVLVLAALGACTSMTLQMVARNKGWPLGEVRVDLTYERIHAKDCEDCETSTGRAHRIERVIHLGGALSEEQRETLLGIAERCPVHRTLLEPKELITRLA